MSKTDGEGAVCTDATNISPLSLPRTMTHHSLQLQFTLPLELPGITIFILRVSSSQISVVGYFRVLIVQLAGLGDSHTPWIKIDLLSSLPLSARQFS